MNIRSLCVGAVLVVGFCSSSIAGIVGSAYDGTVTTSDSDLSVSPSGTSSYTDLTNPFTFCLIGQSQSQCALSGSVFFTDVDATDADINFEFQGSASASAGDTFTVDLGQFVTPDGSRISGIDPTTGSLTSGTFQLASFDGRDAVFTGTVGWNGSINAGTGTIVVFDDLFAPTPEPSSIFLSVCGLAGLFLAVRRLRMKQSAV